MAGTVTETHVKRGRVGCISLACVGDAADGTVPATALATKFSGRLLALETDPGTPAPTANYDLTLVDGNGHDVLEGVGANRHTTSTEKVAVVFSATSVNPPVHHGDTLTFTVANQAVLSAQFTAKIYYEGDADGVD